MVRLYYSYYTIIYMHSPYSFYVQLDDEMGEAGLNSHVRPTL